jgi:hypothetical protein
MILDLILFATSPPLRALCAVGWRVMVAGMTLWIFVSLFSLLAIYGLEMRQ